MPAGRNGGWGKNRKHPEKPIPKREENKIRYYTLTPEELEYYRSLKPPIPDRNITTTAPRHKKTQRL